VAAGLVSLLNDIRLHNGKAPLGLLNPLLYQWRQAYSDAFFDVIEGRNNDGDVQRPGSPFPTFCDYGFPATKGWDPVTGLGSLGMGRLVQVAAQL